MSDAEDDDDDSDGAGDDEGDGDVADEEISDFEVNGDEESPKRPRGRPKKASAGAPSRNQPRGGSSGAHGARGALSPQEERDRAARARRQPRTFATEQARERAEGRKRKRDIKDAVADAAFDMSSVFDVRTLSSSIADAFMSRCCGTDVKPLAPNVLTGAHALDLPFQCSGCSKTINVRTGSKVRLPLDETESTDAEPEPENEPEEEDGEEDDEGQPKRKRRRKQKRRKFTQQAA